MAYKILNVSQDFREKFEPREGLEGPFFYDNNRVLYYCPKQGQYINPQTDHFLSYDEYQAFVA